MNRYVYGRSFAREDQPGPVSRRAAARRIPSLITVYQTLEIHDVVTVTARHAPATALRLTSNDSRVPTDSRNTAWKMILLALEELGVTAEVEIHIDKRLPVQGGLGAGSGNAVAALVGLEKELKPGIRDQGSGIRPNVSSERSLFQELEGKSWAERWFKIAAQVGSDVPLFLVGGTVLGLDRGQEVYPLADIEPVWCVVAVPETGVSTPQAFRDWDALCAAEGLTAEASADRLEELSRAYASAFRGEIPRVGKESAPPVSSPQARTWPDPRSPRLSAPGSRAGSRTTSSALSFPSILPLLRSSVFLRAPARRRQPFMLRCRGPVRRSSGCTKPAEMQKRRKTV